MSENTTKNPKVERLTPKQAQFVVEYLVDLNGTQAAIRAGYSESSAKEIASENLTKPNIMKAIQYQLDCRAERTLITADSVLRRINQVAERCMQAEPVMYFDKVDKEWKQLFDEEERAVYQFDSNGANKALENLARNLKLLTDKMDIGNGDGSNIKFPEMVNVFVSSPEALKDLKVPVTISAQEAPK